jgi:hypothetical protein
MMHVFSYTQDQNSSRILTYRVYPFEFFGFRKYFLNIVRDCFNLGLSFGFFKILSDLYYYVNNDFSSNLSC